ncbi:MAG: hypothetical protein NTW86_17810, partial [Candidatus Sumerlaeota bacterium]|nr:hypothetical protein [Candidatus Sumerlaeota bacterium]
ELHTFFNVEEIDADARDFRARAMGAFLRELGESAETRRLKSGLRVSPFGLPVTWEVVARCSWLVEIGVSTYWPPAGNASADPEARFADFQRQAEAALGLLARLREGSEARTRCWLRCFQVAREDEPRIAPAVERLRSLGAREFNIWSFAGTESLGALACERPREAWARIVEAAAEQQPAE